MKEIGAFEAKNRFSALLAEVAAGQEILITRRGKPIARIVPAASARSADSICAAAERIRARARRVEGKFDWQEWKAYRDEGR